MAGGMKADVGLVQPGEGERGEPVRRRGRAARLSRDAIIGTTLRLLDDMPVERFSMGLLAKSLGAGVMTLYNYFPSRDDLLIAVADEIYSRFDHPEKGGCWQDEIRQWLWATVDLFQRYPVAMKLSLWDGHASPGWLRTWIPVVELIRAQGLDGPDLAFAVRWFTTSALGFITSQAPPPEQNNQRTTAHIHALSNYEAALLQNLQRDLLQLDGRAALTYGFGHIITGLERIIAEAAGPQPGSTGES